MPESARVATASRAYLGIASVSESTHASLTFSKGFRHNPWINRSIAQESFNAESLPAPAKRTLEGSVPAEFEKRFQAGQRKIPEAALPAVISLAHKAGMGQSQIRIRKFAAQLYRHDGLPGLSGPASAPGKNH